MAQTTPAGAGQGTPRRFNRVLGFAHARRPGFDWRADRTLCRAAGAGDIPGSRSRRQELPCRKPLPMGAKPGHHAGSDGGEGVATSAINRRLM